MIFIFTIQFVTGVTGLSVGNNLDSLLENSFSSEMKTNSTNRNEADLYQDIFKCCGWNNFTDYKVNDTTNKIPKSCCKDKSKCPDDTTEKSDLVYPDGCKSKLINAFQTVIHVACAILVTFSVFNFLSISLSLILARQLRIGYQYT
jgi:hypothetical protein